MIQVMDALELYPVLKLPDLLVNKISDGHRLLFEHVWAQPDEEILVICGGQQLQSQARRNPFRAGNEGNR